MSFSVSFSAPRTEVAEKMEKEYAPDCVKEFVRKSIEHLTSSHVKVVAYGHLYDGHSVEVSNASITVTPFDDPV